MTEAHHTVGGRYRLIERLGAGAMGTVWRAEDLTLGRAVAVKEVIFPPGTGALEAEALRERTRREARSAARLDHPSAVTVYDVVEEDGRPWLVMELVEARTLAEVIRSEGPLPPARVAEIGLAVLGALEAAHAQGILHRDVKPGNVLMRTPERAGGRVVLTDFGIATSVGDASLTSTGLILGSPAYISPERARGHAPGPKSDLWSLGATLYTAVEGRPPYDGKDPVETVTLVVKGTHAPYVAAGPLAVVLDGLLAKDPELRLDAAATRALLAPLAQAAAAPVATAEPAVARTSDQTAAFELVPEAVPARPGGLPPRVIERTPRRSRTPLLLGLVVLLLVLAALWLGLRDRDLDTTGSPTPTSTGPATSATPGRPAGVPADWVEHVDPAGWSIWTPASFALGTNRDAVQLRDDGTRSTLRVRVIPGATSGLSVVTGRESAFGSLGSYARVSLGGDTLGDLGPSGELEFTFVDQVALHVLDTGVVVGGVGYELYWQTPASSWTAAGQVRDQVLASFRPRP